MKYLKAMGKASFYGTIQEYCRTNNKIRINQEDIEKIQAIGEGIFSVSWEKNEKTKQIELYITNPNDKINDENNDPSNLSKNYWKEGLKEAIFKTQLYAYLLKKHENY